MFFDSILSAEEEKEGKKMRVKSETQKSKGTLARYTTEKTGDIWLTAVKRWPVLALAELTGRGLKVDAKTLIRVAVKTDGAQELRMAEFGDYVDHVIRSDAQAHK